MQIISIAGSEIHIIETFKTLPEAEAFLHEYVLDNWRWMFQEDAPDKDAQSLVAHYFKRSDESLCFVEV